MSGAKGRDNTVVVGGSPRVDLLPPEVKLGKRHAAMRRRLAFGVVLVFIATAVAAGIATISAIDSQVRLASAQERTTLLLAQQTEFSEVRQLAGDVDSITLLRQAAASTEVNWQSLVNALQSTLPAGVAITTITADVATPIELPAVPTAALEGDRVGTVSLLLTAPTIVEIGAWMQSIRTLDGYVDVQMSTASINAAGTYDIAITVHIGTLAYSERFGVLEAPVPAPADDVAVESTDTETEG